MASVQDSVDCPQCGGQAFLEFETRMRAESICCPRCGYSEHTRPLIDRQKQNADAQHRAWFKRRKDGEPVRRTTRRAGVGAYYIATKNGLGVFGTLKRKPNATHVGNFKRDVARPEIDATRSFLTRWNPKTRQVETVVGQIPPDFP